MKNVFGSEKNFYLTLSLPHNKYSVVNIFVRFSKLDTNEIDLISIYESVSQKLLSIIPNCQFVYINKSMGISLLLSPTEKVEDFLLSGNIQHITSHIASAVTIFLNENNQLEKCDPITSVSCFSANNIEVINYFFDMQLFQFHSLLFKLASEFYDKKFILSKTPEEISEILKIEHDLTINVRYSQEDIMGIVVIVKKQDGTPDIIESYDADLLDDEYLSRFIPHSTNNMVADTEFDVDAL